MAINYAAKYESKVAERFKLGSLTDAAVNKEYKWTGVNTINIYSLPTTALGDYTATGADRYGAPSEQQTTIQTAVVSKDRSFAITVDKKTMQDTPIAQLAGKVLKNQIDEVYLPEVDAYRIAAAATAAVANGATATLAVSASNAYTTLLAAQEWMGNKKVPVKGRIAFCTYAFYNFLKLDTNFVLASDIAMDKRVNGQMGEVDGIKIVPVPSTYMPANTAFVLIHPSALLACDKLEDYKVHDNPPGISGALIEGRFRYDAFAVTAKVDGLYSHKIA